MLQTGVMLLYSFPALSSGYSKTFKPYIFPYILPLTQVRDLSSVGGDISLIEYTTSQRHLDFK